MRQKKHEIASFKQRTISLLLALAVVLTSLTFGVVTTVSAAETLYFDTSQNTAWNPGSGEKLYATFTDSGGNKVDSTVELTVAGTNLYSVTAPSGAANIQLYLLRSGYAMPDTVPGNGKTRVFLKNNANWNPPYAYAWTNGGEMTWPGAQMTKVSSGSTYWYYYDTQYQNVIFGNGTGTSSPQQSADLNISGKNLIFSKYNGNSGWDSAPYYKKYAEMSLGSRPSGANEMYALAGDEVKFSKYPYSSRYYGSGKDIYLYNPDWTDASKVKVTWDFTDPYHATLPMSSFDKGGARLDPGFYYANVPSDAVIQFSYDYASSQQTAVPASSDINCFKMKNGSGHWIKLSDALGETTDYQAPIEPLSNPTNSKDAYWVDAVYYDYLSDQELDNGWLNPKKAGTFNFNGAQDTWYEHNVFNRWIGDYADSFGVTFPLYFGNFCNTPKAYGYDNYEPHNGPFINRSSGLTNFYYYVNNSNGLTNRHYAVRGLAADSLDSSGNIRYSSGASMPYFDSEWLSTTTKDGTSSARSLGKSVNSAFPFRTSDLGSGVTKYSFDSQGAKDNVFFNWSGGAPVSVGYGQGTGYGIIDGVNDFMYNETSGYGIFPFNTKSNPSTNGRGGNSNLDYGFGIKMQMDFRVPEGGVLPNGQDCTFSFSGDDDLWVYISEYNDDGTLGDSILSLDLGGNHKKAEGVINFKTMQYSTSKIDNSEVTKAAVATTSPNFRSDTMYIIDSDNWGDVWIYAWEGGSNKWFHCGHEYINGAWYYTANISQFSGYTNFKCTGGQNNWTHQSANDCKIKAQFGNICYANNPNHCEENASDFSRTTTQSGLTYEDNNAKHAFGFESNGSGGYQNLDPSKTYHMSVFYMERGYIESNCKIEFTMTPAQNDVKVHKEIETADVNSGLQSDLQTNDFEFKNAENDTVNTTARYTLNSDDKYAVFSDGGYYLSHQDTADFDNQYKTGSNLTVTETKPSDGISYGKTYWEVVNLADGERLAYDTDEGHPHTDTSTRAFKLENTNKNSYVTRQVNFVNTPDVTNMTITKDIVDKSGNPADAVDEFGFRLLVDLGDGNGYKARKLTYTVNSDREETELTTASDGSFKFSSQDSVVFEGMPVGAKFMLKELTASGYKPYKVTVGGREQDFSRGEYYGTYSSSPSFITVTNMQQPVTTTLEVTKYVQQGTTKSLYANGSLFTFKAQGLGETVYNTSGDKTVDVSSMSKSVDTTDADGKVVFANDGNFLKFTQAGTYAFRISENHFNPDLTTDNYYDTDFVRLDSNQILALVSVVDDPANPGALTVNDPVYYNYNGMSAIGASSFTDDKKVTAPQFVNVTEKGKVTVIKADNRPEVEDRNKLEDVSFVLSKVDNTEPAVGEDIQLINPHDEIEVFTDENGVAEFNDLDIFKTTQASGSELKIDGRPQYQMYALREIDTLDQHTRSRVVQIFSLPIEDKDGTPHYEISFDYVNGVIKAPETAGPGSTPFMVVGLIVVLFACASLMAYVLYFRKKGYAFAFRGKSNKK